MEMVSLNNVQLDHLANHHPSLARYFYGTVACDRLPNKPVKTEARGYIMNTNPHDMPGRHWIALWTCGNMCEVLGSYACLPDGRSFGRVVENSLEARGVQ